MGLNTKLWPHNLIWKFQPKNKWTFGLEPHYIRAIVQHLMWNYPLAFISKSKRQELTKRGMSPDKSFTHGPNFYENQIENFLVADRVSLTWYPMRTSGSSKYATDGPDWKLPNKFKKERRKGVFQLGLLVAFLAGPDVCVGYHVSDTLFAPKNFSNRSSFCFKCWPWGTQPPSFFHGLARTIHLGQ